MLRIEPGRLHARINTHSLLCYCSGPHSVFKSLRGRRKKHLMGAVMRLDPSQIVLGEEADPDTLWSSYESITPGTRNVEKHLGRAD